jgi:hypothetical protein
MNMQGNPNPQNPVGLPNQMIPAQIKIQQNSN